MYHDINCDSAYMLMIMPQIGSISRSKFSWVLEQTIYLVMDNAGGHGTSQAILEYINALVHYKIKIKWQVPRSSETNLLDLGIWMSIRHTVHILCGIQFTV